MAVRANRRGPHSFTGPAAHDRLARHFSESYGGAMDEETARALLRDLVDARGNPDAIADVMRRNDGALNESFATLVARMMRIEGARGDIAWMPVEALVKRGADGLAEGFKAPPELDFAYQRWLGEAARADPSPDAFIRHMRELEFVTGGTRPSFRDPTVETRYLEYVARRIEGTPNDITDADFNQFPPQSYIDNLQPGGRPRAIMDALFGPAIKTDAAGATAQSRRWNDFFPRDWLDPPESFVDDIVALVSGPNLNTRLETLYKTRFTDADGIPEDVQAWVEGALAHHVDKIHPDGTAVEILSNGRRRIDGKTLSREAYVAAYFNADALTAIAGPGLIKSGVHPDEFLHRLLDSEDILFNVVRAGGAGLDDAASARLVREMAEIPGMFDLTQKVISRSGSEKGYIFELERVLDEMDTLPPDARLALQLRINGGDGPDLVVLLGRKASMKQMKSHFEVYALRGFYGSAVTQMGSDLRRLFAAFDSTPGAGGWPQITVPGEAGSFELDHVFTFYLDKGRLRSKHPPPLTTPEFHAEFGTAEELRQLGVLPGDLPGGRLDPAMLEPGGFSQFGTRVYNDVDVDPRWLRDAVDKAEREFADINAFFAMQSKPALVTTGGMLEPGPELAAILQGSGRKLSGSADTLADILLARITAADPPLTVSQAMALRAIVDASTGEITDETLALARRIGSINPPPQIDFKLKTSAVRFPAGTDWQPGLKGAFDREAAEALDDAVVLDAEG